MSSWLPPAPSCLRASVPPCLPRRAFVPFRCHLALGVLASLRHLWPALATFGQQGIRYHMPAQHRNPARTRDRKDPSAWPPPTILLDSFHNPPTSATGL